MKKIKLFLDYAKARPDGIITNQYSNMVQLVHIDTSYLSETNARSRVEGHFFMSSDSPESPKNEAILVIAKIIKALMYSAAKAKLGALYINFKEYITF